MIEPFSVPVQARRTNYSSPPSRASCTFSSENDTLHHRNFYLQRSLGDYLVNKGRHTLIKNSTSCTFDPMASAYECHVHNPIYPGKKKYLNIKMAASRGKKRESDITSEMLATETASPKEKKSKKSKPNKPLPESKFGGMTEEEVCKLLLPDHMKAGLDIIFVSASTTINCSFSRQFTHFLDWH